MKKIIKVLITMLVILFSGIQLHSKYTRYPFGISTLPKLPFAPIKEQSKNPRTQEKHFIANDVAAAQGTRTEIRKSGGEDAFLKNTIFAKPNNYKKFSLIQKKIRGKHGYLLGETTPQHQDEVIPRADFSYKTATNKHFYKLMYSQEKGPVSHVNCQPRNKRTGTIPSVKTHPYAFPYTIATKKYGIIPYMCYVSKGSPKVEEALLKAKKTRGWNKILQITEQKLEKISNSTSEE